MTMRFPPGLPLPATPPAAAAPPPNNRRSLPQTFCSMNTEIPNDRTFTNGIPLLRAQFAEPGPVTIYTDAPYPRVRGAAVGADGYSFVQPVMAVTWGDVNGVFTRIDVPMGPPITVVGSFVNVDGYLIPYGWRKAGSPPTHMDDKRIFCVANALAVHGARAVAGSRMTMTASGGYDPAGGPYDYRIAPSPGPFGLLSVWGQQDSGTDLFLHVFDRNVNDLDGFNNPANGDRGLYVIPAPNKTAFSLTDDDGIPFVNGFQYVWSTTAYVLTKYNAGTPPEHSITMRWIPYANDLGV